MKKSYLPLISLAGIGIVAVGSYWYYTQKGDDPQAITMKLNAVEPTNYLDTPKKVYPLTIEFSGAAARIGAVKQPLKEGASITPNLNGRWEWKTDSTLTFTPADDWVAGQQYSVKLDKSALNDKLSYTQAVTSTQNFTTPAFTAKIQSQRFYQDPVQAHVRQSMVEVRFSHPVDRKQFEKAIEVKLVRKHQDNTQETITPLNFNIRYADNDLSAWINSDSVSLAAGNNQSIQTTVQPTVSGYLGANRLESALTADVAVPTKFSLSVDRNELSYVNTSNNTLDQLLGFSFNHPVKGTDIEKGLQLYLLPEQEAGWSVSKIGQADLDRAALLKTELIPTETAYAKQQNFRVNIPPQRCAYVMLDNQFSAQGGYQLKDRQGNLLCAYDYPKYVGFIGDGSLLALSGEKKLTVLSRNLDQIRVDVGRVQGEQLRHVANLNYGNFQKPELGRLKFDDIADFTTQIIDVFNTDPRKSHYHSIPLDKLVSEKGIFWVKVSAGDNNSRNKDTSSDEDWRNNELNQFDDYRLVVLTDLGIIAKTAADGSRSVFVQSVATGQPIEHARIQVISRNGSVIEQMQTDATGMALFPNLEHYSQELEPVMYLVDFNGDQSFLPIGNRDRMLDYSRFDVSGQSAEKDRAALKAYLFNDRGIYRPNEPVHIGMVIKAADWQHKVAQIPIYSMIISPSGKPMQEKTIQLDASGLNSLNYTLPENAETGEWEVLLYVARDGEPIGSSTFQVQEFQPDTLKINTRFNQQEKSAWLSPQDLEAHVVLTNLFGTPAQQRQVDAELALHSALPTFSEYADYHFFDNQRNNSPILYETNLDSRQTDEQGQATFKLDLNQYATNTVQMLYFTADGFEGNSGRSVSTMQSVMVSAQPWLIGYRSGQDLAYLQQNGTAQAELIAINPQLEKVAVENLTATLMERKYVSVLTQQDSGAYQYESKRVETEKSRQPLAIRPEGVTLPLDTSTSGDFVLIIYNQHEQEVSRIPYTVVGNQNVSTEMDRNTELKLRLNKKAYQQGETIEIAVQAPYTGSGLITIEADRVYAHQWFKAETNQSVQRITLPPNFEGSGYVNVQFSRDLHSKDIFTSPLSYGVVPFSVNVDNHRLTLDLQAPKQVKSGETVEFSLQTDKPGKAIIYAVNEGILQVARYKQDDPLSYFFPKRALEVGTSQILDLVLPEFSLIMQYAQTGGDMMLAEYARAMLSKNTNPFKRKAEKPVAYWSDIIEVNGKTSVSYTVPESFNGNLKVMAIAVSDDSDTVGIAQTNTLVQNELILSPTVPLTLAPNDQSQVSVNISNTTRQSRQVKVSVTANPQLEISGETEKTVDIPAMSEKAVTFEVKAKDVLGEANLRISAAYQNSQQQPDVTVRNVSVSVRPIAVKQFFTRIGKVKAGESVNQDLPTQLYPQARYQTALFSPTPLALVQGVSTYLIDYDNSCTEQILSAAMPTLLFADKPAYKPLINVLSAGNNALAQAEDSDTAAALQKVFGLLPNRQLEDGRFGMWNNVDEGDLFLTAYTVHFLLEAQEHNIALPSAWLSHGGLYHNAVSALEQQSMPQDGDSLAMLRQRAYSAYLLARLGQVPSNALMSIRSQLSQHVKAEEWQSDIVSAWLAGAYHLVKQENEATQLMNPVIRRLNQPRKAEWQYADFSDPMIQDSAALYLIARHFPQQWDAVSENVLNRIREDVNAQRYNTLSSAMMLLALDSYARHDDGSIHQLAINTPNGQTLSSSCSELFSCAELNEESTVRFENNSPANAWFAISQTGYPKQASTQSEGLEIHRRYTDENGQEISEVKLGDVINVTVSLRALNGIQPDVVVTDLFPSGFEVIWQNKVKTDDDEPDNGEPDEIMPLLRWDPIHTDVREDRLLNYGTATEKSMILTYQLKAVNVGQYHLPAIYAESMYNRTVKAQYVPQGTIKIVR
ncbi:alpha-2-macroglobulin [Glaesserella sp.]|uniref:alpha-2-macroglobulin family protein n=1 Tax=Glaesserella sp. TaxID=2094731 RepID=UPI0035A07643